MSTRIRRETRPFLIFMGVAALIVEVLTLLYFLSSGQILNFWDLRWIFAVCIIAGLLISGLNLLRMSRILDLANTVAGFFGIFYMLASLAIYGYLAFLFISETDRPFILGDFSGIVTLFVVSYLLGYYALHFVKGSYLRLPFYAYGIATLLVVFALVYKYLFDQSPFVVNFFIAEIILLIIGSASFRWLYARSRVASL